MSQKESKCSVCLETMVLPCELPCSHKFCFLCAKGLSNQKCALCRAEFPLDYLSRPKLLPPISSSASTSDSANQEYTWFYGGADFCGWWRYDERTNRDIEDAYQKGEDHCDCLIAGHMYTIDFNQMMQYRHIDPSRRRRVKRDLITTAAKGVAGIQLSN